MIRLAGPLGFGAGQNGTPHLAPGWSTERGWSWSLGALSRLTLPVPDGEGDLVVEMGLGPCLLPPAIPRQRLRIAAGRTTLFAADITGNATIQFDVPARLAHGPSLALTLHHPDAARPADHGGGADPRPLAIRLFAATLLRVPARPAPAGPNRLLAAFAFGAAGADRGCLAEGWGAGERNYAWALGRRATLRIPAPPEPGPHLLLLDLNPAIDAQRLPRQRILVGANGRQLGLVAIDRRTPLAFALPPPDPNRQDWEITFDNFDAAPERDFLRYHDGRNFAFMLSALRILAAPPAPPATLRLPADNPRAFLSRFESLGHTCDFAHLQNAAGVARLGLLHLAGTTTFGLVHGLCDGFRLLGRPDTLDFTSRDGDDRAWFSEPHYDVTAPTGVPLGPDMAAAVLRQAARTLPFLARRLLETIAQGETIFLLRRREVLLREEAEAILATLRLHGDATLLWLVQDGSLPPGEARRLGPRLLQAGLDDTGEGASPAAWTAALAAAARLTGQS